MIKGIEKLPERIKQHILDTVRREFTPPDDRIWVTEVLYCLRKAWFRRKMSKPIDLHSAWHLYRGIIFHNIWEGLYEDTEKKIEIPIWDTGAVLVAKYDFIDNDTIYDLKWVADSYEKFLVERGASKAHKDQVQIYLHAKGMKKGALIYLMSKSVKIFEFELEDDFDINEFLKRALVLWDALRENNPPPRTPNEYECQYCEYKDECIKIEKEGKNGS